MNISPVSYNYASQNTNQKAQRNDSRPAFGKLSPKLLEELTDNWAINRILRMPNCETVLSKIKAATDSSSMFSLAEREGDFAAVIKISDSPPGKERSLFNLSVDLWPEVFSRMSAMAERIQTRADLQEKLKTETGNKSQFIEKIKKAFTSSDLLYSDDVGAAQELLKKEEEISSQINAINTEIYELSFVSNKDLAS